MKNVQKLINEIKVANAIQGNVRKTNLGCKSLVAFGLAGMVGLTSVPAVTANAQTQYEEKVVLDLTKQVKYYDTLEESIKNAEKIDPNTHPAYFEHIDWNNTHAVRTEVLPFDGKFRYYEPTKEESAKVMFEVRGIAILKVAELIKDGKVHGYKIYNNVFERNPYVEQNAIEGQMSFSDLYLSSHPEAFNRVKEQLAKLGVYKNEGTASQVETPVETPVTPVVTPDPAKTETPVTPDPAKTETPVTPVTPVVNQEVEATITELKRLAGADRIKTSMEIAKEGLQGKKMKNVILSYYNDFPDSLGASSLISKYDAPIILTRTTASASEETIKFVQENLEQGGQVIIVGGQSVIDISVEQELKNRGITNIKRLGGSNRYETNAAIIKDVNPSTGTPIIVASATSFADALSASPISSYKGYPIIITHKDMAQQTKELIDSINPSQVYVVGGTSVVSQGTEDYLKSKFAVKRLGGSDRYETSKMLFNEFYNKDENKSVMIAYSLGFADSLSGSYLGFKTKSPLLLVNEANVTRYDDILVGKNFDKVYTLGGTAVVSDEVANHFKK